MAAFRYLALLTVGFVLLMLSMLYHVTLGRAEAEGVRELRGPEIPLETGEAVVWTVDFASRRVEEAWPLYQQQPRVLLEGSGDARVQVTAEYVRGRGEEARMAPAFIDDAFGAPRAAPSALSEEDPRLLFGRLWMSWEDPLRLTFEVTDGGSGGSATPVLSGRTAEDYPAARSIARTQWAVFTAIGAAGIIALLLTLRASGSGGSNTRRPGLPEGS